MVKSIRSFLVINFVRTKNWGLLPVIAYNPEFSIAAYPIILINILGAVLFILLGLGKHRVLLKMPGALLMAMTALFAYLGIN